MITFEAIGTIHSPHLRVEGMPIQPTGAAGVEGTVEVFEPYRDGLRDLDGFSHVILLYHFHASRGFDLHVVPFLDAEPRGVFATRAPRRPNAIGLSVVRLTGIRSGMLFVQGIDVLDGTPLIDIKPYVPAFDAPTDVRLGWLERAAERAGMQRADGRFA